MKTPSTTLKSAKVPGKSAKGARKSAGKKALKKSWLAADVQTKQLTTEELAVPGVQVVKKASGKPSSFSFFYPDQLDTLRKLLRGMRKREKFEVALEGIGYRIHHKALT